MIVNLLWGIVVLGAIAVMLLALACYRIGGMALALWALRRELTYELSELRHKTEAHSSRIEVAIAASHSAEEKARMAYGMAARMAPAATGSGPITRREPSNPNL